ncbi:AAA family ATPase, partial [Ectothiorhodospiraceae bacterium WFHF3C12]|nr:AAA family ATPase [Ectothiorhodospiraceae bacterium WFHF3C12]
MYEQFYQLSEDPFRLTPDPRYAFAHPSYAKARAYLEYGVQRGEGFVAVTGPPGSGKTTLIEELLTRVPPGVRVSHLASSQLEADDLLRMVAHVLGIQGAQASKADLLHQIREFLEEDRLGGRRTVLIVDEAQGLDSAALEELRLLTNLSDPRGPLLQIILLGQEQLRELLKLPELEQLRQRMIAAYHLRPMSEQDTKDYVAHRLRCADWAGDPVISDMAVRIIHHAGGGNPRRINLLCSRLMLHGYVGGKHYLTVPDVRVVLEEMEEEELASWDDSLEELMREEEQREREEESRLASINPASSISRVEAVGGGRARAGTVDPLTTVAPEAERVEPTVEPLHVTESDTPGQDFGEEARPAPPQAEPRAPHRVASTPGELPAVSAG